MESNRQEISPITCPEWHQLQQSFQQFEGYALFIKLFAFSVFILGLSFNLGPFLFTATLGMLWLQEGIIKTYQSRVCKQLLTIEELWQLGRYDSKTSYQLHSDFQRNTTSTKNTLVSYIVNSLKPTVIYPHLVLIFIALGCHYL